MATRLSYVIPVLLFSFLIAAALPAQKAIRAATVETLPGFFTKSGQLQAPEPYGTIIADLERELGLRFEWSSLPTLRLLTQVQEDGYDLCFPMGFTPERDKILRKSEAVTSARDLFIYRKRPVDPFSPQLSVGCKTGSPQESWLRSRGYKVIAIGNYEQLPELLDAGRVDMIDLPETLYEHIIDKPESAEDFLSEIATVHEVGFYYSPNFALADSIDAIILKLRHTWKR